jgi:hypothetical protein
VFAINYPGQGFAPIHEVIEGRDKRIKAFYWFDQDQTLQETIDWHSEVVGPKMQCRRG